MLKTKMEALRFLLLGLAIGLITAPRSGLATRDLLTGRLAELLHLRRR